MDNYVDIHSHILYGIDDGSKTIEESICIIKQHVEMGFTDIVVTPHYIENSNYVCNNSDKKNILDSLYNEINKLGINVNLYLGNEVFISGNIDELLSNDEISSINSNKYLLIELPMHNKIKNVNDIIYELRIKGIIPIIAHPERYEFVQKNPSIVNEWIEEGAILQSNYGSIIGVYGEGAKKAFKKLLKADVISCLATDIHFPDNKIYCGMDKIRHKIKKIIGEERFIDLTINNPKRIIKGEKLV